MVGLPDLKDSATVGKPRPKVPYRCGVDARTGLLAGRMHDLTSIPKRQLAGRPLSRSGMRETLLP